MGKLHYISEFIRSATQEIYTNMVNLPPGMVSDEDTVMTPVKPGGVTVSIQFDGGLQAFLHMTYDEALAKNVTSVMMGAMPASLTAPEVGDVLGELANMISGSFKAKMASKGFNGHASAPMIISNDSFIPAPISDGVALMNRMKILEATDELEIRIFAKV